jgi:hypothetical protein
MGEPGQGQEALLDAGHAGAVERLGRLPVKRFGVAGAVGRGAQGAVPGGEHRDQGSLVPPPGDGHRLGGGLARAAVAAPPGFQGDGGQHPGPQRVTGSGQESGQRPRAIPAGVRAEYLRASRDAVPSIVADYRASAGIDLEHDQADRAAGRTLAMPVSVVQQDWGAALGYDAAGLWRPWAPDLVHQTVDAGHFMAEEAPGQVTDLLRQLLKR